MKNILIIGGTGTISTSITDLLAKDPQVKLTLIDRCNHNKTLAPFIEILISEINQPETSKTLLKDRIFDCVIDFILYTSAQAQARIGIFCDKMKQFIFISTVVCLDHEHHLIINKEISRGHRFSLYVQNKAAAELIFLEAISTSLSQSPSYDLHKPTVDSEFLFQSKDKALG